LNDNEIKEILEKNRVVAVVGLSRGKIKESHIVAQYLKNNGYKIIPVNPFSQEILGEKCYKDLPGIPYEIQKEIEIVDIFRPSDEVMPIVDEAIEIKKKHGILEVVWMQLGIINEDAARRAQAEGLKVVMNRCMMIEHGRLLKSQPGEPIQTANEGVESKLIQLNDSNFDEYIKKSDLMVVDFWAPWCGPCKVISPIIEALSTEFAGKATFGKIQVDKNPSISNRFGVISIPTIIFIKDGKEVDRIAGAVARDYISNKVKEHME